MKKLIASLALLPLAACMDTTPVAQEVSGPDAAEIAAVWDTRQPVAYKGKPIEVAMDPAKTYALIGYKGFGETVSVAQLTGLAAQATGCTATEKSILSHLSGPVDTPIPTQSIRAPGYLRVALAC